VTSLKTVVVTSKPVYHDLDIQCDLGAGSLEVRPFDTDPTQDNHQFRGGDVDKSMQVSGGENRVEVVTVKHRNPPGEWEGGAGGATVDGGGDTVSDKHTKTSQHLHIGEEPDLYLKYFRVHGDEHDVHTKDGSVWYPCPNPPP
jgi:hypothetical protein